MCVRLAYCLQRFWFGGDSNDYVAIAKNLRFHHAFAFSDENGQLILTAFRPLLYPLLVSLTDGTIGDFRGLLLFQCFLGAATVVLTYLLAREICSRTTAIIAGLLLTFAPLTVHFTATVLGESLFTFVVITAVFLWRKRLFWAAGISFGMAALAKPIVFPFFVFLIFLAVLFPVLRKDWKQYLVMFAFALLTAAPWIVRNTLLLQTFTLTQSSGYGTNLLYGGIENPPWAGDILTDPLTRPVEGLNEIEQDRARMKTAINRITETPFEWLRVRVKQYPKLFFHSGDYIIGKYNAPVSQALQERNYLLVFIKFVFIFGGIAFYGLAIWGAICLGKNLLLLPHIFVFPIFLALIHLPMWIETRYFLPAVPLVCILAAFGGRKLLKKQNFIKIG